MKNVKVLNLKEMNWKEAFEDETIFVLKDFRMDVNDGTKAELRCRCLPTKRMSGKFFREMVLDDFEGYAAIKIEP